MIASRSTLLLTLMLVSLVCTQVVHAQTTASSVSYSYADLGGATFASTGAASTVNIGYGPVQPGGGTMSPSGVAIFGYRSNGILVTEAGVAASLPVLSGRTYAEVNGPVNTGIAIANPNNAPVTISFYFTNSATGSDFGQGSFTLAAGAQQAAFVNQSPYNATNVFTTFSGSFTFSASAPVGVVALRGFTNQRGDFLIATQAVASISSTSSGPIVMAQFADGGGWTTNVVLVNTSDQPMTGIVQFYSEGSGSVAAAPINITVNGQIAASFTYTIPGRASVSLDTAGLGTSTQVGSVIVTPTGGSNSPSSHTLFSFVSNGITVAQASVVAQPASTAFRMFVQASGTPGQINSIDSGVAITNTSATAASVNVQLYGLNGVSTGLTASLTVPASGHVSRFLEELFPSVTGSFQGVMRVSSSGPVAVVALRTRYNERGDFLITTTAASDETAAATTTPAIFPHIVDGGGYTTQFILFSGTPGQSGIGTVQFVGQTGQAMTLTYQ